MSLLGAEPSNPSAGDAGTTLTVHEAADRIARRSEALAAAPAPEPRKPRPTAQAAADEPPAPVDEDDDQPNGGEGGEPEAPADGESGTAEAEAGDEGSDEPASDELDLTRKVKVKIGGREIEIPLSEALSGYQREADYRQKTQTLAEERRAAEEAKRAATEHAAAVQAERAQIAQLTNALKTQLLGPLPTEAQLAELERTDPTRYLMTVEQIRRRVAAVQALDGQTQQILARTEQEAREARAKAAQEGMRKLTEAIPEAADPAKWEPVKASITSLIREQGYSPEEIAQIVDPRIVKFAHQALQWKKDAEAYRKLKARQPATEQRVVQAPPTVRPGTTVDRTTAAEARVKELRNKAAKTGSVNAIADLIAAKTAARN